VFLNAYRYRASQNALNVHLPALYAEIDKGPLPPVLKAHGPLRQLSAGATYRPARSTS